MIWYSAIVHVIKLKVKWLLAVSALLNAHIQCVYVSKSLHSTETVEMTLHHCFTFKSNMNCSISNHNTAEIDSPHHFCIHACKAVTFQVLYHLLDTISLLSFILHCLVFTEHLRTLYLLNLSLWNWVNNWLNLVWQSGLQVNIECWDHTAEIYQFIELII